MWFKNQKCSCCLWGCFFKQNHSADGARAGRAERSGASVLREHAHIPNDVRGLRSNNVSSEADVNACSNKSLGVRGCAEADLSACYNQAQLGVSVPRHAALSQVGQTGMKGGRGGRGGGRRGHLHRW